MMRTTREVYCTMYYEEYNPTVNMQDMNSVELLGVCTFIIVLRSMPSYFSIKYVRDHRGCSFETFRVKKKIVLY